MRSHRRRAVQLALMLLHERRLGDASQVAGYVQQLPRGFSTPLHWSPAQREQLQYPHLQAEVRVCSACLITTLVRGLTKLAAFAGPTQQMLPDGRVCTGSHGRRRIVVKACALGCAQ